MKTIVLDTNIWLSELALMSPVGCAFSHYITVSRFKIGLPEVVEEEAKYNFRKNLFEYRANIEKDYKRMLAIFGKMKELVLPTDEDIERKVAGIFAFHQDRLIRIPFDMTGARSSFDKLIKKEPPNSESNQQFKDGVIWANCMELAKANDVLLVTKDKSFYKDRTYERGLAENLSKEAQSLPHKISIFIELTELLDEIRSDVRLEENRIVELIEKETHDNVMKIAERLEFDVEKLTNKEFAVFATTDPKEVSVKFSLRYGLENKAIERRVDAHAESRGEFLLDIQRYNIRDFINHGEYIFWLNENGELIERKNSYGYLNAVLGHKTIEHQISYKLREK